MIFRSIYIFGAVVVGLSLTNCSGVFKMESGVWRHDILDVGSSFLHMYMVLGLSMCAVF